MKAETFFKLTLHEVLGVSEGIISKYFKEFRKTYRQIPQMIESLEQEVVNSDGITIPDNSILQLIEDIKNSKVDKPKEFCNNQLLCQTWYDVSLINLFFREIATQLDFALVCYKDYLSAKNKGDIESTFLHIHHFLIHSANIDKLLDKLINHSSDNKNTLINLFIDMKKIEIKPFRKARNHLEHFEERLYAWFYLYVGGPILDLNFVNSETTGISEERTLRLLRTDEDIFVILGERFELRELFQQICILSDMIKAFFNQSTIP